MTNMEYCPKCGSLMLSEFWLRRKDGQLAYHCIFCGYKNYTIISASSTNLPPPNYATRDQNEPQN